jgi:predicted homoserine dehydrogenase-like protein
VVRTARPLGLAHDVKVLRPVKQGQSLSWADVAIDTGTRAYQLRREMEAVFAGPTERVAPAGRVVQAA